MFKPYGNNTMLKAYSIKKQQIMKNQRHTINKADKKNIDAYI